VTKEKNIFYSILNKYRSKSRRSPNKNGSHECDFEDTRGGRVTNKNKLLFLQLQTENGLKVAGQKKKKSSFLQRVEKRFQVSQPGKLLHQVVAVAPPQRPKRIIRRVEVGNVYKLLLPLWYRTGIEKTKSHLFQLEVLVSDPDIIRIRIRV
jgi:hypothetical protein